MEFIVVVDGNVVGQIFWDGVSATPNLPKGAVLLTVAQAIDFGLGV